MAHRMPEAYDAEGTSIVVITCRAKALCFFFFVRRQDDGNFRAGFHLRSALVADLVEVSIG